MLHLLLRVGSGISSRGLNLWFRLLGVRISGYVWMRRVSIPRRWSDIVLCAGAALDDGVVLLSSGDSPSERIVIGSGTYINRYTIIDSAESIVIGSNTLIGPHCYITDHDHGRNPELQMKQQSLVANPVRIGSNVWLGAGVIVLKGVSIGDNAIVAAGAVVTRQVPPGSIVGGIPARILSSRSGNSVETTL